MKSKLIARFSIVFALVFGAMGGQAAAQHADSPDTANATASGSTRSDSRIVYHNGPVLTGTQVVSRKSKAGASAPKRKKPFVL
jgi:hypothetical protein